MKVLQTACFSLCLFVFLLLVQACKKNTATVDILSRLEQLPGISVAEIETLDHFDRLFEIRIEQPIDHMQPNGDRFSQKLYLGHVDESLALAFETEGYARSRHKTRELSTLFSINQLTVEHRYFGESVPTGNDWQYLNIWQAANDHHRIAALFKEIYPEAWISSGASKGGDAAVFHRRFFPEDVDATLAYVAPILFEEQDRRYLEYYNTVGDEPCRQKMKNFQRNMLINIDSFPPLFEAYVDDINETYNTNINFSLSYRDIVYHATREDYAFEFWSSEIEDCNTIPEEDASIEELFNHFIGVFDIFLFFSDGGVDFWTPWLYQAETEIGNYAYDVDHLQDLEMDVDPLVTLNAATNFDPTVMADIDDWVRTSATNMIFIYGEKDPWTVAAFDFNPSEDMIKIINAGTKHGPRFEDLTPPDKADVMSKLRLWLRL